MPEVEAQYDETAKLSEDVKQHTSKPGQDLINQEMAALRKEIDGLHANVTETENTLRTCIVQLEQYSIEQAEFTKWLEAAEGKVKTQAEPSEQQLAELEVHFIVPQSKDAVLL